MQMHADRSGSNRNLPGVSFIPRMSAAMHRRSGSKATPQCEGLPTRSSQRHWRSRRKAAKPRQGQARPPEYRPFPSSESSLSRTLQAAWAFRGTPTRLAHRLFSPTWAAVASRFPGATRAGRRPVRACQRWSLYRHRSPARPGRAAWAAGVATGTGRVPAAGVAAALTRGAGAATTEGAGAAATAGVAPGPPWVGFWEMIGGSPAGRNGGSGVGGGPSGPTGAGSGGRSPGFTSGGGFDGTGSGLTRPWGRSGYIRPS